MRRGRAKWVEVKCLKYGGSFQPLISRLCDDLPICYQAGERRHFAKIMAHVLKSYTPTPAQCESIASAAAQWVEDPTSKMAVKIWSMDLLSRLRCDVEWLHEMCDDLVGLMSLHPTLPVQVALRRWRVAHDATKSFFTA